MVILGVQWSNDFEPNGSSKSTEVQFGLKLLLLYQNQGQRILASLDFKKLYSGVNNTAKLENRKYQYIKQLTKMIVFVNHEKWLFPDFNFSDNKDSLK